MESALQKQQAELEALKEQLRTLQVQGQTQVPSQGQAPNSQPAVEKPSVVMYGDTRAVQSKALVTSSPFVASTGSPVKTRYIPANKQPQINGNSVTMNSPLPPPPPPAMPPVPTPVAPAPAAAEPEERPMAEVDTGNLASVKAMRKSLENKIPLTGGYRAPPGSFGAMQNPVKPPSAPVVAPVDVAHDVVDAKAAPAVVPPPPTQLQSAVPSPPKGGLVMASKTSSSTSPNKMYVAPPLVSNGKAAAKEELPKTGQKTGYQVAPNSTPVSKGQFVMNSTAPLAAENDIVQQQEQLIESPAIAKELSVKEKREERGLLKVNKLSSRKWPPENPDDEEKEKPVKSMPPVGRMVIEEVPQQQEPVVRKSTTPTAAKWKAPTPKTPAAAPEEKPVKEVKEVGFICLR